ncbi:MAG: hypothetical protein EPN91_08625 [Salinibacterium sp.]|nr:MAG: hypothetical protein EPN91_08625 [Salinibacterium sp.]
MPPPKKPSFLSGLIDTLSSTAATELSERLGDAAGMSARGKATMRRQLRHNVRNAMRDGADAVTTAAKKVKEKVTKRAKRTGESISSVQFMVACSCLGIDGKYGKPVDSELIREKKRERAKLFHPDRADGSRERFQAVMQAAEWLEKYNAELKAAPANEKAPT